MARSIVPGWGQFYTDHNGKGYLFAGGALTSLALTLFYVNQAYTAEDYYNQAVSRHLSIEEQKAKYDDTKNFIMYRNIFAGVTAGIWAANLIDAYFDAGSAPKRRAGLFTPYTSSNRRGSEAGINYNLNF